MSDKKIDIWNILHDGEITAVSEDDSKNVTIFINIPYLRRRIKPIGDSIVLILYNVSLFEFKENNGNTISSHELIEDLGTEILSTISESMPLIIETTLGELKINFVDIRLLLDTGQEIDIETIEKVSEEYWTEWEARNKRDH